MSFRLMSLMSLLLLPGLVGVACAAHEAFTDPAKAGPDFAVQGEYAGECKIGEETMKMGAQVIALGNHEFEATGFHGGLPGDGWSRGDKSQKGKGKTNSDVTEFNGEHGTGTIKDGTLTISDENGNKIADLKKVERQSPTLGAKSPEGAIVLFDGTSADAWKKGKIVEGNLLWNGATSKQAFGDFTLHVEFRCPYMPDARGQARGNSGVYLQDRYEVQVLDSFGLEGKDDDCGGIYKIAQEKVNMSFPPLAWQTYDIDFTAARFDAEGKKTGNARTTVKHNGVVVQDDLELPHVTPGGAFGDEKPAQGANMTKGPIYLQDHGGDPVVFRNIWVVEKK
ncbi:MAG TPA: DUF1080 domain-containing protein [Pirellulales bacterium]|jgi:hypothetical protein|nr:DUF1080 domain-containing protein [Pirellulales bacterium]